MGWGAALVFGHIVVIYSCPVQYISLFKVVIQRGNRVGCGWPQVRQSAGLLLKNNLKDQYAGTTEEFRRYIKVGFPRPRLCLLYKEDAPALFTLNSLWGSEDYVRGLRL